MNIGVILQARMGSTRLPGKILMPLGNKVLLEHIFYRISSLQRSVMFVLATTDLPQDDVVESFCRAHSVECFRGSSEDVLERYYLCSEKYGFQHIVRLTGDNPFVDIEELDRLIDLHIEKRVDYSHSFDALPVGIGAEIFTAKTLEKSHLFGKQPNHREHVNEYVQENPGSFNIGELSVNSAKNRPDIRLTIDTEEDYCRACFIVEESQNVHVTTQEAIDLSLRYSYVANKQ